MLKKQLFFISILYTLALAGVCLIKLEKLPDVGVSYADKIFHLFSYITLCVLWFYSFLYRFQFGKIRSLTFAGIFAFVFGIIIEVLQEVLTETRASDFYDVVANTAGILVGVIFILIIERRTIKK